MVLVDMCDHCREIETIDNCGDCNASMCEEHSHECLCCRDDFCSNCIHKCESCEGYVCNKCLVNCTTCDEHALHEACAYQIGDDWYCEDHTEECSFCDNRVPTDDIPVCVNCDEIVCEEHKVQVDTEIMCKDCTEDKKDNDRKSSNESKEG